MLGCTEPLMSGTGLWILIAFIAGFVTAWSSKKKDVNSEAYE